MEISNTDTELGSIERELYVDAAPETVYEVISDPEHVRQWWSDNASYEIREGASGQITFGEGGDANVVALTILEAVPPLAFAFRWAYAPDEQSPVGNSLLVTFQLVPAGSGTLVRFRETGFRAMGWEAAQLEEAYRDHLAGWNHFLPRLVAHAQTVAAG